jgi:hypothetical protein
MNVQAMAAHRSHPVRLSPCHPLTLSPCHVLILVVAALVVLSPALQACPFCDPIGTTLSEELGTAEVAVIAKLAPAKTRPAGPPDFALDFPKSRFTLVRVLKGQDMLGDLREIEVLYVGDRPAGTRFFILGNLAPDLTFGAPIPLSARAANYVGTLPGLPAKGAERLTFFQDYLEHKDFLLATDAYGEFARASYAEVKELGERLDHDQLVAWIKDPQTPDSHRRQYLTLLAVCGQDDKRPSDIAMLEEVVRTRSASPRPSLDATIACYLTLTGEAGLPLIEEQYLKDKDAPYTETHAAIQALRFHGQEERIIPRERLAAAIRNLLDRPHLADLVIPDLARWQDWSAMDRLVALFKEADSKSRMVRIPVAQYLKICPLPEAARHLEELAKIDPKAIEHASLFPPLGGGDPKPVPPPERGEAQGANED